MGSEAPFLPYGRHLIEDDDVAAVAAVMRGEALTGGPAVTAFESALKEKTGAAHAVVCGNGTQALHLAALAAGIGPGDRVICPAITFLATANCARYAGAEVVFADVDPDTGLITAETAEAAAARVGGPVNAVGDGRWADFTIFSFHPVKTVAMGEGGAITTNDAARAARMASLRNHGTVRTADAFTETAQAFAEDGIAHPWYYEMQELGFNYRACDLQCALGVSQLAKLERFAARRRHLAGLYDARLAGLASKLRPLGRTPGVAAAWHLYAVLIEFEALGLSRDTVMARLRQRGVGSQVHYIPVPWQPYYRRRYGMPELPGAARYYARTLSLPLYPGMADGDVDRVADALERALAA